jgi:capsular exopolysaccharide synthesis family protein
VEPLDYLRILRRRWAVVLAVVVFGLVTGFVTSSSGSDGPEAAPAGTTYQATTTLIVDPGAQLDQSRSGATLSIERAAFFTTVGVVPERVKERLGYEGEGAQLAALITAAADSSLGTLRISTTQSDPDRAVELADAFATELLAYIDEQGQATYDRQVRAEIDRIEGLESEIAELDPQVEANPDDDVLAERRSALVRELGVAEQRLSGLTSVGPARSGFIVLEEPAPIAMTESGFQTPETREARVPLFGAIALVLGMGLALLVERLDTRARGREEIEEAYGFEVIGDLPEFPRRDRGPTDTIVSMTHPRSSMAEAYRSLRTSLSYVLSTTEGDERVNGSPRRPISTSEVILVTSAEPSEGKTTTVANLAAAFAEHGRSVLVLDCDFRRPRIHQLLNVERGVEGMSDILVEGAEPRTIRRLASSTAIPGVRLLSSGATGDHPSRFLATIGPIIDEAREMADVVLIDSSPILAVNDVAEIVPNVDLVSVVVRVGKVPSEDAARSGEFLRRLRPSRVGLVLIGGDTKMARSRDYYVYGEHHGLAERLRRLIARRRDDVVSDQPAEQALEAADQRTSPAAEELEPGPATSEGTSRPRATQLHGDR